MTLAIFALTKNGIRLAKSLSRKIDADYFINTKRFNQDVESAFKKYDGLLFIMATGIVVRAIAPFLKSKAEDPAVVVMDEKGLYVISLLSGHLGGANNLAKNISKKIGAKPVITTATDVNNLPCIEDIAARFNLTIEDVKMIKMVNSAIVNGKIIAFVDENTKRREAVKKYAGGSFKFYKSIAQTKKTKADVYVVVIPNSVGAGLPRPYQTHNSKFFILRPNDLVVGIGCDRGVALREVEAAFSFVLKKWDVSPLCVRGLASIDVKQNETGLLRFAKKYNLKIDFYSKEMLADMPLPSGFSEFVMGKVGVGGVCEPAAMKSAGIEKIWIKKQKIGRVTIAAAKVPFVS